MSIKYGEIDASQIIGNEIKLPVKKSIMNWNWKSILQVAVGTCLGNCMSYIFGLIILWALFAFTSISLLSLLN